MTFPEYPKINSPISPTTLPDGVNPLPLWAYGDALKVDPTNTKREEGWALVPDQDYGEEPPLEWQNNEMFNNGQWASFFKAVADYLKAGNFDNGIHVTGNSQINGNLEVNEFLTVDKDINVKNYILFYNNSDLYTGFKVSSSITQTSTYEWPKYYPSVSGSALVSDNSGNMSWYDLKNLNKIYTTSFLNQPISGTLCSITNIPAGKYLVSAQIYGYGAVFPVGSYQEMVVNLVYPGHPSQFGIDILAAGYTASALGIAQGVISFSGVYINIGSIFTISLDGGFDGSFSNCTGFLSLIPVNN